MSPEYEPQQSKEYLEQQTIQQIALGRHPEATGVREIQPILAPDEKADMWLVILTTGRAFENCMSIVTGEDIQRYQQEQQKPEENSGTF